MPWSGTGFFSRIFNWNNDALAGIPIQSDRMDQEDDSFADGINNALAKDGQNTPTATLPMAGFRHTNVGNSAARNEYATVGQTQDDSYKFSLATGAGGAYSVSLVPAVTTLVLGAQYRFQANHINPGAATLNINATGSKNILLDDGVTPLTGAEIQTGQIVSVVYDGTQFRLNTAKITAFARSLLDDTDAPGARTTLALGTSAVLDIGTSGNAVPKLNGGATTWADGLTVTKTTNTGFFTATSSDGGSSAGPEINLYRNSSSPAAADFGGIIRFYGNNNGLTQFQYGSIFSHTVDVTGASEDGEIGFNIPINGTGTIVAYQGKGLRVGDPPPADQGTGTVSAAVNYYRGTTLLPIQQTIESGELAATAGATVNLAHGFGAVPKLFRGIIRNKTTEFGYAVGDEVEIGSLGNGANLGASICADATNVSAVIGGNGISLIRKDTFVNATITAGNWKVVLRAWA